MKQVFDAVSLRHFADPSAKIIHAEVRIDDTVLMLSDSAEGWPSIAVHVHIYVADVDATYQGASFGASTRQEKRMPTTSRLDNAMM